MNDVDAWLARVAEVLAITGIFLGPVLAYVRRRLQAIDALAQDVASIKFELQNNGGKSMKDVVERTEEAVGQIDQRVDRIETSVARLTGRFDEHSRITNH